MKYDFNETYQDERTLVVLTKKQIKELIGGKIQHGFRTDIKMVEEE